MIGTRSRLLLTVCFALAIAVKAGAQNPVTDWNNIAITAALAANQTTSPGSSTQVGSFVGSPGTELEFAL